MRIIMRFKILVNIIILFICFICLFGCKVRQGGEKQMSNLTTKKVLMVVAPIDFRDEELFNPKKILENAGVKVMIASKGVSEAKGMLGGSTKVDLDLIQVKIADYDALVFVGGSGAEIYFNDTMVLDLVRQTVSSKKVVAAICIAPSILANADVLKGKKATVSESEISNLQAKGAEFINQPVVQDGNLVTASGPSASQAFGEKIVEMLYP